ncbi:MAG: DUF1573 domain-containing protein, partial [Candidatus Omnitrophica bacterium]|nr:DUF1573 domain-containing protein [Candidatus Omnitrophota bacterium]
MGFKAFITVLFISSAVFLSATMLFCLAGEPVTVNITQSNDPNLFDGASVSEGEVLKHTFVFKNTTKRKLKITQVNASCGCIVSEVKKRELLPGGSTLIETSLNTKGYSGNIK